MKLLIANRGEIAIRIARAAAELDIPTVAVYSEDDARSLHLLRADEAMPLNGVGPRAYLDGEQIVEIAKQNGCDAIHPGYGFLSENAAFAHSCEAANIQFVGPTAKTLELFGDKAQARSLAQENDVPVIRGISEAVTAEQASSFFEELPSGCAMLIKAVGGGGGRGMRIVTKPEEIEEAFRRASSEAEAAFGNAGVFVEQLLERARHVEVQIAGDHTGAVCALGDRDCSLQRRHQKLIEIAPAPDLPDELRAALESAALRLAEAASYQSLGTFEFLVGSDASSAGYAFIEANARLQVEHTVTEEVSGIDLVQLQLELARGRTLAEQGVPSASTRQPLGFAIQARVNMETMSTDGATKPSGGTIAAFEVPTGPGLRTDTFGYAGYQTSPSFDSLLAKVIGHAPSPSLEAAAKRTHHALRDFRIEGVETNAGLLRAILAHPDVLRTQAHTRFVDENIAELVDQANNGERPRSFQAFDAASTHTRKAGVKVDSRDPSGSARLRQGKR